MDTFLSLWSWTRVMEMRQKKTKFGHEEVHSHELGVTVGLATQSVQGMGEFSVWRHGKSWLKYGCNNKITRVQHLGEILK
jgi:hypothetical protein